jgi:hypothetical protein
MSQAPLRCSFCGKDHNETFLVAGPTTFICEECVALCADIVATRSAARAAAGRDVRAVDLASDPAWRSAVSLLLYRCLVEIRGMSWDGKERFDTALAGELADLCHNLPGMLTAVPGARSFAPSITVRGIAAIGDQTPQRARVRAGLAACLPGPWKELALGGAVALNPVAGYAEDPDGALGRLQVAADCFLGGARLAAARAAADAVAAGGEPTVAALAEAFAAVPGLEVFAACLRRACLPS